MLLAVLTALSLAPAALAESISGTSGSTLYEIQENGSAVTWEGAKGTVAKATTRIRLKRRSKTLYMGDRYYLPGAYLSGYNPDPLYVESMNHSILLCGSDSRGAYVDAVGRGTAYVRYYSGTKSAKMKITVKRPGPKSVSIEGGSRSLLMHTSTQLRARVYPQYANQAVRWYSSNKKVATVDSSGRVTALKEGRAIITAKTKTGGKRATCTVQVYDSVRRRAAVFVECSGTNGSYTNGFPPSMEGKVGLKDYNGMIGTFERNGVPVTGRRINPTGWSEVKRIIQSAFAGADSDDVSYLYIKAHGSSGQYAMAVGPYRGYYDRDDYAYGYELKSLLDTIPGTKVVILESCFSGGVIGKAADDATLRDFAERLIAPFREGGGQTAGGRVSKNGEMAASNYYVLCAATQYQQSWSYWATKLDGQRNFKGALFTYSLGKGAGWNNVTNRKISKRAADANKDGRITFQEMHRYTYRKVNSLIRTLKGVTQTVVCYPENDFSFTLFN